MEQITKILPKAAEELEHQTRVDPRNTRMWAEFGDFQTFDEEQLIRMKTEAVKFARALLRNEAPYWLSLLGSSGIGKTMLARRISKLFRCRRAGQIDLTRSESSRSSYRPHGQIIRWQGGFISWRKISSFLREGDFRSFDDIICDDFVALDDIGSEYMTDFTRAKLFEFLSRREGKWTALTANLSLQQIGETIDPRIASRMLRSGSVVVDASVQDFNLRTR